MQIQLNLVRGENFSHDFYLPIPLDLSSLIGWTAKHSENNIAANTKNPKQQLSNLRSQIVILPSVYDIQIRNIDAVA